MMRSAAPVNVALDAAFRLALEVFICRVTFSNGSSAGMVNSTPILIWLLDYFSFFSNLIIKSGFPAFVMDKIEILFVAQLITVNRFWL